MNSKHRQIIQGFLGFLIACVLASCGSSNPDSQSALKSGNWKQIKKKPPTYYPKDTPADHPATFRDGYWVKSGDAMGTRFFIPMHNTTLPPKQLIAEAQAAMTPEAKEELQRKRRDSDSHEAAGYVVGRTTGGILALIAALWQMH
ncbi:MAG: hypothetical protein ABGZ49_13000 [Akkermansiaceae bacterium]